jgi:YD repeat-containing protein
LRVRQLAERAMTRLAWILAIVAPVWGQALDCFQPADVKLTPQAPRVNLTFQGSAGETVYIRLTGSNADPGFALQVPRVVDQFGNSTAKVRFQASAGTPGGTPYDLAQQGYEVDLLSDSLFTLQLQSVNPALSGNVHVVMVRVNRPCSNNVTLACGRSAAGTISAPTASAPPANPGQIDTFKFSVQQGDSISFRLLRVAGSSFIDTNTYFVMAIYDGNGKTINVDSNGRLTLAQYNSRVDLTVAATGTLTILVFEATGARGGTYYVSATKLNGGCSQTALSCGVVQDSQLTTPLSFNSYTLAATQGDVWQVRIARADSFGTFTPSVEVYDSQGKRSGAAGPASPSGHASALQNITFPSTGAYTVLVGGPLDGTTGAYSVSATRLNKPCAEQSLGCSSIVDGSINGVLRSHIYSLSAQAGDNYLIRLLQNNPATLFLPRVDIYDATGGQVQFINTPDLARRNFTAAADGTYTMVVTDSYDGGQSGTFSLSLLRLNRPCGGVDLSCGAPASGNLSRALASGVYTYTAAAGESFSVRMLPAGSVQPAIEVYDATGTLTGQAVSGPFGGADVVRPAAGSYTIVALDNSKTPGTGAFTVDLVRTKNACGRAVAQGQSVSGVVSATSPFVAYTIAASQDDVLSLRSASSTAGFTAQMEIYDPDGNRLDAGVFGLSRKAAASGQYTVIMGASAPRTAGGFAFAWQALNRPVGTAPLACGSSTAGVLAGTSQFRYYTFAADAGDTMRLLFTKTSDNFAPVVELFDPAGARLAANSDVTQKAVVGGNYLLVVSPSSTGFETGSYTAAFQRPNNPCSPAALTCGQTSLRGVTVPGQVDTLTFTGSGGDLTEIRLATRSGNYSPFVEMYNQTGARLTTSSNGLIRSVLTADGQYTLLVRDRGAINLGSYRVSMQDATVNCPVTDTEAPSIALLRPTGGEVVPGAATFRIQWLSDDNVGVASHDIALSTDGGKTFNTSVASGLNGNQQVFDWLVPGDVAPSRTAVLRVTATDAAGNSTAAMSDLLTLVGSGFPANLSAVYTYDALNRLTQVKYGDGRTVQYTWDAAGNLVQIAVTTPGQ